MGKPYIKGGTPVGTTSLCKTCSYAHIMTGYRESEQMTMCNAVHPNIVVPFLMYECSGYYDKNRPDVEQMQKLAIDVVTNAHQARGLQVRHRLHPDHHSSPAVTDDDDD